MSDGDTAEPGFPRSPRQIRKVATDMLAAMPKDGPLCVLALGYALGMFRIVWVEKKKAAEPVTFAKVFKLGFSIGVKEARLGYAKREAQTAKTEGVATEIVKHALDCAKKGDNDDDA